MMPRPLASNNPFNTGSARWDRRMLPFSTVSTAFLHAEKPTVTLRVAVPPNAPPRGWHGSGEAAAVGRVTPAHGHAARGRATPLNTYG